MRDLPFDRNANVFSTWSIVLSALMIILGLAALALPFTASLATALTVGWGLIAIGVFHFAFSWHAQSKGDLFRELLLSPIYLVCGAFVIRYAFVSAVSLAVILGISLGMKGLLELVAGFVAPRIPGLFWQLLDGILSLLFASIIWVRFPNNAVLLLGVFVGTSILLGGLSRLQFFLTARRLSHPIGIA